MRFALLVYENAAHWATVAKDVKAQCTAACLAWHNDLATRGHVPTALVLHEPGTAASVRQRTDGFTVTDGPFAETKEVLGGVEVVECASQDEAIAIAKAFPALAYGFTVEVRRVITLEEQLQRMRDA